MLLSTPRTLLLLALLGASLVACAPRQDYRGAQIDEDRLKEVRVGVSTEPQVGAALGSPSTTSTFPQWGTTWYYISSETEAVAFLAPEVIDQQVLAISFDKEGKVREIKRYGLKDGRQVAFVDRETPTKGKDITVLEQLLGNFGRFNSQNTGRANK
jgi:outer membrane protein assembly factor BamE (lipoprotein component of BamABCDE complex)